MIEVDATQARQIWKLVTEGVDVDKATRQVMGTPTPTANATAEVSETPKKNKYGAIKEEVDGHTFDSKAEARRYRALRLMEQAGEIRALELQPVFPLHVGDTTIGKYVADFTYEDADGTVIVEDTKGVKTPMYRWKKRHMKAEYGIDVKETT